MFDHCRSWAVVPAAVLLAITLTVAGEPVRIDAPTTITTPGTYVLTRDITSHSGPAITVASEYVTLDLAGHTVATTDRTAVPLRVLDHLDGVVVHNGRLRAGRDAAPVAYAFAGRVHEGAPAPAPAAAPTAIAKVPPRPRPATASFVLHGTAAPVRDAKGNEPPVP